MLQVNSIIRLCTNGGVDYKDALRNNIYKMPYAQYEMSTVYNILYDIHFVTQISAALFFLKDNTT